MGFFHKFLSLGSRKSKKQRAARQTESRPVPPPSKEELRRQQEEQEEVASRLLRSSSLRYAVVNEVDYAALPPLRKHSKSKWIFLTNRFSAHPINSLNRPQAASLSRSSSIQTRRTYTVTIRGRKVEALTEFPNANPPLQTPTRPSHERTNSSGQVSKLPPVTPKDQNRLHVLRQDPSVASLLDMYDNNGRLDSNVFSNTPTASEKEPSRDGRAQVKRGGSTLRQLLGNPESSHRTSTAEGDISWAEAFLRYDYTFFYVSLPLIYLILAGKQGEVTMNPCLHSFWRHAKKQATPTKDRPRSDLPWGSLLAPLSLPWQWNIVMLPMRFQLQTLSNLLSPRCGQLRRFLGSY